ncbi:MAG: DUF362 domain-containing protein [Promethearchaeota archaeon]|jgi:uncharacterized Fe-S center protein
MQSKSVVYWASPNEVAALPNTAKNMVTNNLVKTRIILDKILDNIQMGDKVGVKVHVGESHNTHYLRPDYVREVVNAIKAKGGTPTLIETQGRGSSIEKIEINDDYTICVGHRKTATDHKKIARFHGYTESVIGAPLHFIDGEEGIEGRVVMIDGIHFKEISVAAGLFDFDKLVVVSHFKGHAFGGFGGALKQIGLGCVTKHNKVLAHFDNLLKVDTENCKPSNCDQECIASCRVGAVKLVEGSAIINESECYGCFKCSQVCPIKGAIMRPKWNKVEKFIERFMDNATAVISFGPEKIRYINFALDIPLMCDCASNASVPVIPDLGIFGSADPVAVDKACFDKEIDAPGLPFLNREGEWTQPLERGVEKFRALMPNVNPAFQFEAAIKNKIGSTDYELVKI